MSKLTIQQFAFQLGTATRKTRDASLPFHTAYEGASPEQRADLRQRWMLGHIEGALNVKPTEAERILSTPRTERSNDEQKAYLKASADFSYHVIRPEPSETKAVSHARVSKAHRDAAKEFLAMFDDVKSAIAALKAVAK